MPIHWEEEAHCAKDGQARSWVCWIPGISITVHRHIRYSADTWLLTCRPPLFDDHVLKAGDIEKAKSEALQLVREDLRRALQAIDPADCASPGSL